MNDAPLRDDILGHLDRGYLVETLSRLARVPTDVPLGFETLMEPDDPKLVHYVQRGRAPRAGRGSASTTSWTCRATTSSCAMARVSRGGRSSSRTTRPRSTTT